MEQAVRERVGLYHGLEFPIECYNIHSKGDTAQKPKVPHYHEYIEFLYATDECDISVWIAGESISFRKGDLVIINSNTPHTFFPQLPINNYICIKALPEVLYFSKNSYFDARYVTPFLENNLVRYRVFGADELEGSGISEYFFGALDEWKRKEYGYEVSLRSLVFRIFLWTIRKEHGKGYDADADVQDGNAENVILIHRALDYVNLNFSTVTEAQAATTANMSYSHFSRVFKRVMGRSFKDYLASTRINAAERMLFETDIPITQIALACGFATSSHFIDRFKKTKGVTPKKYRQIFADK
jgi:AraC-like DNA-binding protein